MNRFNKRLIFFLVSFILINVLGCTNEKLSTDDNIKTKDDITIKEIDDEKLDSDTLKVLSNGVKGVFNPLFALSDADRMASSMMFMPFVGFKSKMEYDPENSLVKKMSMLGNVMSFELRDDISWWDKVPVTSEDIVFSLEMLLNRNYYGGSRRGELFFIEGAKEFFDGKASGISGVEIVDSYKLNITFEHFEDSYYYAFNFRPIPKHYYEKMSYDLKHLIYDKPMGNGAYQLASYEANNFILLKANNNFIYDVKTPKFLIRDIDELSASRELTRGNLDIAVLYGEDDFIDEDEVLKHFDKREMVLNKTYMIRISNSNSLKSDDIRKRLLKSINASRLDQEGLIPNDSLISPVNKAYIPMNYNDLKLEDNEKKFFTISLIVEDREGIDRIAELVKKNWSEYGFVVNQVHESSYKMAFTAKRLVSEGRNVAILSEFNHGYRPDFSMNFSSIGDGENFFFNTDGLDEAIFDALHNKNSSFKNGYEMLLSEYKNRLLARGIGSPIARQYVRKGVKNVVDSEFLNWYEFDIWNIGGIYDIKTAGN